MSFYGLLWRFLPGPKPVKAVEASLLALTVVAILFNFMFPLVAAYLPVNDITVGDPPLPVHR